MLALRDVDSFYGRSHALHGVSLAVADRALVLAKGQWALDLDAAQLLDFQGDARRFEAAVLQAMG